MQSGTFQPPSSGISVKRFDRQGCTWAAASVRDKSLTRAAVSCQARKLPISLPYKSLRPVDPANRKETCRGRGHTRGVTGDLFERRAFPRCGCRGQLDYPDNRLEPAETYAKDKLRARSSVASQSPVVDVLSSPRADLVLVAALSPREIDSLFLALLGNRGWTKSLPHCRTEGRRPDNSFPVWPYDADIPQKG